MGGGCEATHTVSPKNEALRVDTEFLSDVRPPYKRNRSIRILQYIVDRKNSGLPQDPR